MVSSRDNRSALRESARKPDRAASRIYLHRMLALLRPYGGRLVVAAVLLIITNGLGLIFPLVVRSLLNTILVQHDAQLLNLVVEGLIVLFVVQAAVGAVQSYLVTAIGERLTFDLRTRLFSHLQRLPLSFFDSRRTGELSSRVTNDVTLLQGSLTGNVLPLASQVVTLVGSIAIAFVINWRITLVALVVTPVAFILAAVLGRRIRQTTRDVQRGLGDAGIVLEEALSTARVVKTFARESYEAERFSARMRVSLGAALRRAAAQSLLGPLTGLIAFMAVVVVIWFGGREVLARRLTAGDLVAFIFYLFLVIGPLIALSNLYSQLQAALAAAERVFELLDEPVEPALAAISAPP
ncbi:MAG: ABC transporter transmembrane domain-containing protein, partial [Ktedonobacterales bacterium]